MNVQDYKGIVLHIIGCLLIFYSGFMFGRATVPDHGNGAGEVRQELDRVEQLGALKLTLEGQEQSLQNANRLLQEYEREERSRQRKIKRQRNIAYVIAAVSIFIVVRNVSR